jgi:hypothetical protein
LYADDVVLSPTVTEGEKSAVLADVSARLATCGLALGGAKVGAVCGGCAASDHGIPARLAAKLPLVGRVVAAVLGARAPLHVKFNIVRMLPSLFVYSIQATALSHPSIALAIADAVDAMVVDALEAVTEPEPVSLAVTLGVHALRPTVAVARVAMARALAELLANDVQLALGVPAAVASAHAAASSILNVDVSAATLPALKLLVAKRELGMLCDNVIPQAAARYHSLCPDLLSLHGAPIDDERFRAVVRLLCNPIELADADRLVPFQCPLCKTRPTDAVSHRLTCTSVSAARMERHTLIECAIASLWREATGFNAVRQPAVTLFRGQGAKADLAVRRADGSLMFYDITVAQPESASALLKGSAKAAGRAAGILYYVKQQHYAGSTPAVTPLVWEAYGTPHDETRKALGRLASAAAEYGHMEADVFLRALRGRVCAALLHGLARALCHPNTLPIIAAADEALKRHSRAQSAGGGGGRGSPRVPVPTHPTPHAAAAAAALPAAAPAPAAVPPRQRRQWTRRVVAPASITGHGPPAASTLSATLTPARPPLRFVGRSAAPAASSGARPALPGSAVT